MADLLQYWLLDPAALLFIVSLLTVYLLSKRRKRNGRRKSRSRKGLIIGFWLVVFLACSAPSIVNPILTTLEDQYVDSEVCDPGTHLVMLGGGVDSRIQSATEFERMTRATMARASATARIAVEEPWLRVVIAGGALDEIAEADVVAGYLLTMGANESQILREKQSANTRENAVNVAELLSTETVEGPVRLLTSAMHMPRAIRTFQTVFEPMGLDVCPVSVDREALSDMPLWAWMPQTTALVKFGSWLHEIAALAMYKYRGWIK